MSDVSPLPRRVPSAPHRRDIDVFLDAANAGWGPTLHLAVLMLTRRLVAAAVVTGLALARARGWI